MYGGEVLQPLYRLNKALMPKLIPVIYSTMKTKIEDIFDIPFDNAIATTKIAHAITLLNFNGKKIRFKIIKNNFLYLNGISHMPIFSDDIIAYSTGSGFLVLNLHNKTHNYYNIAGDFDYVLSDYYALIPKKRIFIFKIIDCSETQPTFLRLLDLSSETSRLIKEKEVGDCGIVVRDDLIFLYNKDKISALDSNLEEIEHPLIASFNRDKKKEFGNIIELIIHPRLTFAILKEKKRHDKVNTWVISWRENNISTDNPLMFKLLECNGSSYKFSYDGKWMFFENHSSNPYEFVIMPIDPDLPHFLGKPIFLGEKPEFPSGKGLTAMIRNPSGFVVTESIFNGSEDVNYLKKWDFTEAEN